MFRAQTTHWFELITTRKDFAAVMQALAGSGTAELQSKPIDSHRPVLRQLETFLDRFATLRKRYGAHWPTPGQVASESLDNPEAILQDAIDTLESWTTEADPLIAALQALAARRTELEMAQQLVEATGSGFPFAAGQRNRRALLDHAIYFLPDGAGHLPQDGDALISTVSAPPGQFVMAIAAQDGLSGFHNDMNALKAVPVPVPDGLSPNPGNHADDIMRALDANAAERDRLQARLDGLADRFGLYDTLTNIAVLNWLYEHREDVQATDRTLRITGWTSLESGDALRAALEASGASFVLSVAATDEETAPLYLSNPGWLRAFEFFPRMLGVPSLGEADPSPATALIAPVMFGFMFGDVGQGAVLVLIGLLLRKRLPLLTLLIPGGIAAMVFGILFGSVFSREDIIPALWLHPLNEPITVLAAALGMGILFLFFGMGLDLLQAIWRGRLMRWLLAQSGITVAYGALLLTYWLPSAIWGLPLGIVMTILGARDDQNRWTPMALAGALGEFLEALMRLLVSSVSFSRVGAFALAHAGLSTAIVGIADAVGGAGALVIMLLGNALIIGLEGLVTGIQTTRLVLFEFFTRFYRAEGREFRPLTLPQSLSHLKEEKTP